VKAAAALLLLMLLLCGCLILVSRVTPCTSNTVPYWYLARNSTTNKFKKLAVSVSSHIFCKHWLAGGKVNAQRLLLFDFGRKTGPRPDRWPTFFTLV